MKHGKTRICVRPFPGAPAAFITNSPLHDPCSSVPHPCLSVAYSFFPLVGRTATTTHEGCLHDMPSVVMATQRFFFLASATHTFQPGASTPGNSGSRPLRLLPLNFGPRVNVRYFMSGDHVT